MKVTIENLHILPEHEQAYARAILDDVLELNTLNHSAGYGFDKDIWLEWQDYHNEYSPERTDPCPDYYGYYGLMHKTKYGEEPIAEMMPLKDIDWLIFGIIEYTKGLIS